ncbi:MAG: cytochrome c-type biogenesis protein CcmH [Gemmatirosa sp.]|nr:cytochrome c-type biogenesis protein CcmH [Gemmatirosa sp.]
MSRSSLVAPLTRRRFLGALGAGAASALVAGRLAAQQDSTQTQSAASNVPMDDSAYRPVVRAAKPGARPQLDKDAADALEHRIGCACPCTLDVYTCRTTDFSCGISPRMHGDVQRLVDGGYSGDEIIAAFVDTYGEQVLMEPTRQGFNWAGYIAPFVALGTGAVVVGSLIRRWGARAALAARSAPVRVASVDASADELARLDAAVRNEDA